MKIKLNSKIIQKIENLKQYILEKDAILIVDWENKENKLSTYRVYIELETNNDYSRTGNAKVVDVISERYTTGKYSCIEKQFTNIDTAYNYFKELVQTKI